MCAIDRSFRALTGDAGAWRGQYRIDVDEALPAGIDIDTSRAPWQR